MADGEATVTRCSQRRASAGGAASPPALAPGKATAALEGPRFEVLMTTIAKTIADPVGVGAWGAAPRFLPRWIFAFDSDGTDEPASRLR